MNTRLIMHGWKLSQEQGMGWKLSQEQGMGWKLSQEQGMGNKMFGCSDKLFSSTNPPQSATLIKYAQQCIWRTLAASLASHSCVIVLELVLSPTAEFNVNTGNTLWCCVWMYVESNCKVANKPIIILSYINAQYENHYDETPFLVYITI